MARNIGYSGTLAADYDLCDKVILYLDNSIDSAGKDKGFLEEAQSYASGCDGIGSGIDDAIKTVSDRIDRMTKFKEKFSDYMDDIKEFDNSFSKGFSNDNMFFKLRNIANLIVLDPIDMKKLNELVEKQRFYNMMYECYGFSSDDADLIAKAYELAMKNETYLTEEEKLFVCQTLSQNPLYKYELTDNDKVKDYLSSLSGLSVYNGFQWGCVADIPSSEEAEKYFKGIGMSDEEVEKLKKAIADQHKNDTPGKKDFAHEIVEIASYLNDSSSAGRIAVDAGSFGQTNEMASMKGDIYSGMMSESDLLSNIDSYNIYNRMKKNKKSDFMDIFKEYNVSTLKGDNDRKDEYCKNYGDGDAEKGKKKIKEVTESWTPVAEYDTGKTQSTFSYIWNQFKHGMTISAYTQGDPGLKHTHDQVDEIVNDMNQDTNDYKKKIKDKNDSIEAAKKYLYDYLGIK